MDLNKVLFFKKKKRSCALPLPCVSNQVTDEIVQQCHLWSQSVTGMRQIMSKNPRMRTKLHMRKSDMFHFGVYKWTVGELHVACKYSFNII